MLYKNIYEKYLDNFKNVLIKIPYRKRNKDTIIIFCSQFLSEGHAPTRTVLERCYTMGKLLNKKILLINTRLQYTKVGSFLYFNPLIPNVIEKYNSINSYTYKDYDIPFYQPNIEMPNIQEIQKIINKVKELKPWFILSIGTANIVADICSEIILVASMALVFSTLPTTMGTFSILGRELRKDELEKSVVSGYTHDKIIESTFTFDLKPKNHSFSREDFNLPKNKFILAIVGIRLDSEIDKEFLDTMCSLFNNEIHIVFIGYFDKYKEWCTIYPILKRNSTFIGYCNDMLHLWN